MRRYGEGVKAVVMRALRVGLGMTDKAPRPVPFEVIPPDFDFRPGNDLDRLDQLVDDLEVRETAKKIAL